MLKSIFLVIQREYVTRVRKPSFWILTIIVPLLLAGCYAIPIILATRPMEHTCVLVVDESGVFQYQFESSKEISYYDASSLRYAQKKLRTVDSITAVVHIPARATTIPTDAYLYYCSGKPASQLQNDVDRQLQNILRNNILLDAHNISEEDFHMIPTAKMRLHQLDIETGRDGFLEVKILLAVVLAVITFFTIMMFGSQVLRGVAEEKTSHIVEVILCSVRPFQLMMGKVVGIAFVGLTQLAMWLVLSGIAVIGLQASNSQLFEQARQQINITQVATKGTEATAQMEALQNQTLVSELMQGLASIDFGVIVLMFLFFFLFGYLLYASLFAAVGSLLDADTDGQQFTLPITIPLVIPILFLPAMMNEPSGSIATWLSMIPFTSPIAMMFRVPFGVPIWQVVLSMSLLLASFPLCTWFAARIYKSAILYSGSKITYKTLFRLLRRK